MVVQLVTGENDLICDNCGPFKTGQEVMGHPLAEGDRCYYCNGIIKKKTISSLFTMSRPGDGDSLRADRVSKKLGLNLGSDE